MFVFGFEAKPIIVLSERPILVYKPYRLKGIEFLLLHEEN